MLWNDNKTLEGLEGYVKNTDVNKDGHVVQSAYYDDMPDSQKQVSEQKWWLWFKCGFNSSWRM